LAAHQDWAKRLQKRMPMAKVVVTGRDEEDGNRIVKDMTDKGQ